MTLRLSFYFVTLWKYLQVKTTELIKKWPGLIWSSLVGYLKYTSVPLYIVFNPLTTAIGRPFLAINRQLLELESISNPLRIQQVF